MLYIKVLRFLLSGVLVLLIFTTAAGKIRTSSNSSNIFATSKVSNTSYIPNTYDIPSISDISKSSGIHKKTLRPYPVLDESEKVLVSVLENAPVSTPVSTPKNITESRSERERKMFVSDFEQGIASSKIYDMLVPVVPMIIGGISAKGDGFQMLRNDLIPNFSNHTDDYLQYVPAAAMIIMKAAGVKGRSSWGRMLVADAFSVAIMASAVNALKYTVKEERPDGSKNNSFPSGHTATAFMCASMLSKEFSCVSPWIGVGGYAIATATGVMRIANNKHWLGDVMVGAGIGIISTEIAYMLADIIFKEKGLKRITPPFKPDLYRKPSFLGINLGLSVPIHPYYGKNNELKIMNGSSASIEGAGFVNRYLGVGGQASVSSFKLKYDNRIQSEHLKRMNVYAGVYASYPIAACFLVGGRFMMGMNYYPSASFSDISVKSGGGFGLATGVNMTLLLRKKFGLRFFADYELSHSAFGPEFSNITQYFTCGTAASIAF